MYVYIYIYIYIYIYMYVCMYIYNRIMVKNATKFQVLRVSCKLL